MQRAFFLLFLFFFLVSAPVTAALETVAYLLVEEIMDQLEPLRTTVAYLEDGDIIFEAGRGEGLRQGSFFEIYSQEDLRYLGLVKVVEVRSRNARGEIQEELGEIKPGDLADEYLQGSLLITGFFDETEGQTPFSSLFPHTLAEALFSYNLFEIFHEKVPPNILKEKGLDVSDLTGMKATEVGEIFGIPYVIRGNVTLLPDEILVSIRLIETSYGRMLARGSHSLVPTPFLEALFMISEQLEEEEETHSVVVDMEIRPPFLSLLPGEKREVLLLCYDAEGFLLHQVESLWSASGDFIQLSGVEGEKITITGIEEGQGRLRVRVMDKSHYIQVEVLPAPVLTYFHVTPETKVMAIGESVLFKAEGSDQYLNPFPITPEWSILSGDALLTSPAKESIELTAIDFHPILLQARAGHLTLQVPIQVVLPMVLVEGRSFPTGIHDEGEGLVSEDFWIGRTPVTYQLFYTVRSWALSQGYIFANLGREGSHGTLGGAPTKGRDHPVTNVNWNDAIVFCNALSERLGYDPVYWHHNQVIRNALDIEACAGALLLPGNGFRLPTSHEWELAGRFQGEERTLGAIEYPPGSNVWWGRGDHASGALGPAIGPGADSQATGIVAWYRENTDSTKGVGQKPAGGNHLGLYDMSGNIWEWCFDGDSTGRIIRGGCWMSLKEFLVVGFTYKNAPEHRSSVKGFRLARSDT